MPRGRPRNTATAAADDGGEDADSRERRVLRGGSFSFRGGHARSASRGNEQPDYRRDDNGFRVVASRI